MESCRNSIENIHILQEMRIYVSTIDWIFVRLFSFDIGRALRFQTDSLCILRTFYTAYPIRQFTT